MKRFKMIIIAVLATSSVICSGVAWGDRGESGFHNRENEERSIDVVITVPPHAEIYHGEERVEPAPPPPPPPPPRVTEQPPQAAEVAPTRQKKQVNARILFAADMLPFQLDLRVGLGLSLHAATFGWISGGEKNYYGGFLTGLDLYPCRRIFRGIGLGLRGGYITWGSKHQDRTNLAMGRAILSYNWLTSSGFSARIGLGMQYIRKTKNSSDSDPTNYILPHFEAGIGFAF